MCIKKLMLQKLIYYIIKIKNYDNESLFLYTFTCT